MKTLDHEIYTKALSLVNNLDTSFLVLADILAKAQDENPSLYASLMAMPGLGRRAKYHLIEIDKAFGSMNVDKSTLANIGWTKLSTIAKYVTPSNGPTMLALAQTHTNQQLRQLMAGHALPSKMRVIKIYLSEKQFKRYRTAMLAAGAKSTSRGLSGQERALMRLVSAALKKK